MSEIEVKNLTFGYPDGFENVFENASFRLDTNWRLGLVGRNGKGKATLLKLLRGEYEFDGTIFSDAEFFYFPGRFGRERNGNFERTLSGSRRLGNRQRNQSHRA